MAMLHIKSTSLPKLLFNCYGDEIPVYEFYKNHSTKIPINEKEEIIERIVGILYFMDLKKIIAVEKQIDAMRDV